MADVDKALPNVEQTIKIPSPEELQVEVEKTEKIHKHLSMFKQTKMVVLILILIHHK